MCLASVAQAELIDCPEVQNDQEWGQNIQAFIAPGNAGHNSFKPQVVVLPSFRIYILIYIFYFIFFFGGGVLPSCLQEFFSAMALKLNYPVSREEQNLVLFHAQLMLYSGHSFYILLKL